MNLASTLHRYEGPEYLDALSGFSWQSSRVFDVEPTQMKQYGLSLSGRQIITMDPQALVVKVSLGNATLKLAGQLREMTAKLSGFMGLPPDWDGYGAKPTSASAAIQAVSILAKLVKAGGRPPQLVPTNTGGVQLEWHVGGKDVEIEVLSDGRVECYVNVEGREDFWSNHQLPEDPMFQDALSAVQAA